MIPDCSANCGIMQSRVMPNLLQRIASTSTSFDDGMVSGSIAVFTVLQRSGDRSSLRSWYFTQFSVVLNMPLKLFDEYIAARIDLITQLCPGRWLPFSFPYVFGQEQATSILSHWVTEDFPVFCPSGQPAAVKSAPGRFNPA